MLVREHMSRMAVPHRELVGSIRGSVPLEPPFS